MDERVTANLNLTGRGKWWGEVRDWQAILVIIALVAFFFRDILLQKSFLWEDFVYQYYPWRAFAAVSVAHGELPLWNPFTFCGMPFQADIQTALFYIPNLLLTLFVSGDHLGSYWVEVLIVAHVALGGVCMYYLGKSLGLERVYALFAGLTYSLSGFMIVHAIHQTFICQIAWSPLVFLLLRNTLRNRSIVTMMATGLVLGHALLAGSPQLTLYLFLLLGFYVLWEFYHAFRNEGLGRGALLVGFGFGVFAIALLLAAVQLMPTLELAGRSLRSEMGLENSGEGSLAWVQFFTLLVPNYFGVSNASISTFVLPGNYWQFWETCFYCGITGLCGILFSLWLVRKDRTIRFFSFVMLFALLYAVGDNFLLHPFFYKFIPGFDKFRVPARMLFLFIFAGSLMSGFGLRAMYGVLESNSRSALPIILSMIAAAVVVWVVGQAGALLPDTASSLSPSPETPAGEALKAALIILLLALTAFLVFRYRLRLVPTMTLLITLQLVDLSMFGDRQNNGNVDPERYFAERSSLVQKLKEEGTHELFRVNARYEGAKLFDRNQGMVDRIFLMEGYTPLALQRRLPPMKDWEKVCDLMNAKYRTRVDTVNKTFGYVKTLSYYPRAFLVSEVRVIGNEDSIKAFMESDGFNPRRTVVLEDDLPFRMENTALDFTSRVQFVSYKLNAISVDVSAPGNAFLLLSEIYYPGWNAYVDGNPQVVYCADYCLRGIPVTAGNHRVEFRFEPKSFRNGLMVSMTTFGVCIAGAAFSKFRRNRSGSAG